MKTFLTFFSLVVMAFVISCNQKPAAPSQEDFDKLSKKIVDSETKIAQLEDEIQSVKTELLTITEKQDSMLKATQPKTAKSGSASTTDSKSSMQWVDWEQLKGGSTKTYNGVPYTGGFTKYYPNRTKEVTGYYTNGYRSGKWTYYNKNGTVKDVKYY